MTEDDNEISLDSDTKGCITCGTIGVVVLILTGLAMIILSVLHPPPLTI